MARADAGDRPTPSRRSRSPCKSTVRAPRAGDLADERGSERSPASSPTPAFNAPRAHALPKGD